MRRRLIATTREPSKVESSTNGKTVTRSHFEGVRRLFIRVKHVIIMVFVSVIRTTQKEIKLEWAYTRTTGLSKNGPFESQTPSLMVFLHHDFHTLLFHLNLPPPVLRCLSTPTQKKATFRHACLEISSVSLDSHDIKIKRSTPSITYNFT